MSESKLFSIHNQPNDKKKELFNVQYTTYLDSTLLSAVKPIEMGGNSTANVKELKTYVEYPLLAACQLLNLKGIRTVFSSANYKNVGSPDNPVHIIFEFDQLSDENKDIAKRVGVECSVRGATTSKGISLQMKITETTTVGDVKWHFIQLVNNFVDQREATKKFEMRY